MARSAKALEPAKRVTARDDDDEVSRRPSQVSRKIWLEERTAHLEGLVAQYRRRTQSFSRRKGRPLHVLAEGDSWFKYPVPGFGGGVITRLGKLIGVPILNVAEPGDEVRFIAGARQRAEMIDRMITGPGGRADGARWDVLLFSGGGNDIVDEPLALWLRDYDPAVSPEKLIDQARFDAALSIVKAGYEDLIGIRDRYSPDTFVVFHEYDYPVPDGRGLCWLGPWMKPAFDIRGFPGESDGFQTSAAVVKEMLVRFRRVLHSEIAARYERVAVVATQGALSAAEGPWHNELHPSARGFTKIARLFHRKIAELFPGRVREPA